MAVALRILPPSSARPVAIIRDWPGWRIAFSNNSQCLINPEPSITGRHVFAFSREVVKHSPWITRHEDVLIVAGDLAFVIVATRDDFETGEPHTLLCEYRGMRS
jgi:hypothetical protein